MKKNKIAFIICVNNEQYFEECVWYLDALHIPDGYETDIIAVREADSAASGYNAGMESSDAKYKVYLHQDVFIRNRNFITDLLTVFQMDDKIGLAGLIGGVGLPKNAIIYNSWNCGQAISGDSRQIITASFYQEKPYLCVEAIDGMLMATQHDIRWRDDILKEWDFYDVSQSLEFRREGYQVVIPYQDTPWVIHDCGHSILRRYDHNRKIILKEYQDFPFEKYVDAKSHKKTVGGQDCTFSFPYELDQLTQQFKEILKGMVDEGKMQTAEELLLNFVENSMDTELTIMRNIMEIAKNEQNSCEEKQILQKCSSWKEYINRYKSVVFILRRIEIRGGGYKEKELVTWLREKEISYMEAVMAAIYSIKDKKTVFRVLALIYEEMGQKEAVSKIVEILKSLDVLVLKECNSEYCNEKIADAKQMLKKRKQQWRTQNDQ